MGRLQQAVQQLKSKNQLILNNADRALGLLNLNEARSEDVTLPSEIFDGFNSEKSRKSTTRRTMIVVKSDDRDSDREEIGRRLKQQDISFDIKDSPSLSGFDPIFLRYEDKDFVIVFKPVRGGMSETTLNSSITELFPCIAWETNYKPKKEQDFYDFIIDYKKVDSLKCIHPSDLESAKEFIDKAPSSSKFKEKMQNAIAITKYFKELEKDKKIKTIRWGYRKNSKPPGVDGNHPGDVYAMFADNTVLGISLKAGGKKTSEPKLNTYVGKMFEMMNAKKDFESLGKDVYNKVYKKIEGLSLDNHLRVWKNGRDRARKDISLVLRKFSENRKTKQLYEQYYNEYLELNRMALIKLFAKDKKRTLSYIKSEILRDAPDTPTVVIKAIGNEFKQVTEEDDVGVFLPVVKVIRTRKSPSSKQDWFIDLQSKDSILTMKMSVRTNKGGHNGVKKLGQFNLAVKYNGIIVK